MDESMSVGMIVQAGLTLVGLFLAIYFLAVLTPRLARRVDAWIADYRKKHAPGKDPSYGVRSIYELPPAPQDDTSGDENREAPEGKDQN
ncbi:MAG: hypothetical protein IJ055_00820 [Oscillospiraceae bacterium]|nr:hypothetical protein [Oscillospiraceae bacterium]